MQMIVLLMSLFSTNKPDIDPNWIVLENEEVLEQILSDESGKAIVLFKHSTRCGISFSVKQKLEKGWDFDKDEYSFYYLDIINHRNLSSKIAERLDVQHESPQIMVVKEGKVLYHESHGKISMKKIKRALTGK
jgi:bacillithiol system protein YtxJ